MEVGRLSCFHGVILPVDPCVLKEEASVGYGLVMVSSGKVLEDAWGEQKGLLETP